MATDPQTLARYQKSFGYLNRHSGAAPAPALSDLAASSPAVRTAFERAGLLAPSAAPAQRAPRPAPAREIAGASWDSVVAKITSEVGLDRGGATFKHPAPSLVPHPTCPGASTWESTIDKLCHEAGIPDTARGRAKRE